MGAATRRRVAALVDRESLETRSPRADIIDREKKA
jgi:hypothetical protein